MFLCSYVTTLPVSNQPQPLKRMEEAILGHGIRHKICHRLDLLTAIAHGYAYGTVFKHRNIDLGIPEGNGILNFAIRISFSLTE